MTALRLPPEMRAEIVAHALADAPRECCGLIAGKVGEATRLHRLSNLEPGTDFYRVDDAELYALTRRLDAAGEDVWAIYHSHPTSPAEPSTSDIELAAWPDAVYLICSLAIPGNPALRGFRIVDGTVTEVELVAKSAV